MDTKPLHSKYLSNALAACGLVVCSAVVQAEEAGELSVSGNVALSTDYVFRYVSQTLEEPSISGGFDVSFGDTGLYVGTWASNVDFGDDANIEIDFYGGWATEFANGLGLDIGIIDYEYFDDVANDNLWEVYGGISYSIVSVTAYFGIDNSFDNGDTDNYVWVEAGIEYPVGPVTLAGTVGTLESDVSGSDYTGWSVGISTEAKGIGLDLTYHDTDSDGEDIFGDNADSRVVFTISKAL